MLGGHMGAADDGDAPWLPATRALLARNVARPSRPWASASARSCSALACGGRVEVGAAGIEAGVVDVRWRPEAGSDVLLGGAPVTAASEHVTSTPVVAPPAGRGLAGRRPRATGPPGVPASATEAWGVQFHPEAVAADVHRLGPAPRSRLARRWGIDGDAVVAELRRPGPRGRARRAAPGRPVRRLAARDGRDRPLPAGTGRVVRSHVRPGRPAPHRGPVGRGGPPVSSRPWPTGAPLRIALLALSYRSKPHCGGQGVYVRHLSRELALLGHDVEVLSGPPYPELDDVPGLTLTRVPSLDLYREPDPFRVPGLARVPLAGRRARVRAHVHRGLPGAADVQPARRAGCCAAASRRPDVVHDNQTLGYGLLALQRGRPPRRRDLPPPDHRRPAATTSRPRPGSAGGCPMHRWYSFLRMQGRVAASRCRPCSPSRGPRPTDIRRDFRVAAERITVVPVGVDSRRLRAADACRGYPAGSSRPPAPTSRSRASCRCSRRSPSCAPSATSSSSSSAGPARAASTAAAIDGSASPAPCASSPASASRRSSSCSARPRSPSCPACTRASACRRSR